MKWHQGLLYMLSIMAIYSLLFLFDLWIVNEVINLFTFSDFVHLLIYIIFLLVINPVFTYLIGEKLPFKVKGLKVEQGLEEELKKDVSI